ncbi:hypothetical protein Naga_100003g140 [Nannochloropsis gaditana]|uniref:Uncharacterized protein n=1 Tax=Nannochloropsis gaditana TaxID=72520 RepID=W7TT07_9STRA|nr:hypothetical protein Naga_100003g140 [Nannochloropsis gaditana]
MQRGFNEIQCRHRAASHDKNTALRILTPQIKCNCPFTAYVPLNIMSSFLRSACNLGHRTTSLKSCSTPVIAQHRLRDRESTGEVRISFSAIFSEPGPRTPRAQRHDAPRTAGSCTMIRQKTSDLKGLGFGLLPHALRHQTCFLPASETSGRITPISHSPDLLHSKEC